MGWCQYGPKDELSRIDRKRGYVQTAEGAWRITCLFVSRDHRRAGVARHAVKESLRTMKRMGVQSVEAYPVRGRTSASFLWSGTPELFEEFGFSRVEPLGKSSSIYSVSLR